MSPIGFAKRDYYTDFVVCIDATSRMFSVIANVKRGVLSLCEKYLNTMETLDPPKSVLQLRVKVIVFREFGVDVEPLEESPFFVLHKEKDACQRYLDEIKISNMTNDSANPLEALALAMKSGWTKLGDVRRHIIMLVTNSPAMALGEKEGQPGYPEGMPKNFDELRERWETKMDKRAKRLLVFAPDTNPWSDIVDWTRSFHTACAGCTTEDEFGIAVPLLVYGI